MFKPFFLMLFFESYYMCIGQTVYRNEVFNGGVCVAGFSTALGVGQGQVELYIEPGSQIKSALLLSYTYGENTEGVVKLNSESFIINSSNLVSSNLFLNQFYAPINLHIKDITEWYTSNISLNPIFETTLHPEMPFRGVFAPLIYIEYYNQNMPSINSIIIVNNQPIYGFNEYNISGLNPILINNPVGFSLYTDRIGFSPSKYTDVSFNSINLGTVFGSDNVNSSWQIGVKGHFYYQNSTLFGLDDDLPNSVMNESDGLADVSGYISNLATNVNFQLEQINYPNILPTAINSYLAYFLTYTSPCQPFNASLLTSDTTVCAGVPLQLGASGGTSTGSAPPYEWLPQQNLSCYDCPNPVFLGDSTINYTVRIRNTDSCSVVYPVRVRVLPKPNFESIEISESVCGGASGEILARPVSEVEPPHLFQLNGANTQLNEANYTNLAPGFYTITLTDGNACKRDSIVEIGEFNNVLADFSVNPSTGAAPLDIQISNQSQNASQYFWDFSDESGNTVYQGSGSLSGVEAPLAGLYTLTLIATNGFEHCADTASLTILVYDTLQLVVPNVFTPNGDGSNDWFGITATLDTELQIVLLNRWGNVMVEQKVDLIANTFTPLWDGQNAPDGVYFYKIVLTSENKELNGFVEVRR